MSDALEKAFAVFTRNNVGERQAAMKKVTHLASEARGAKKLADLIMDRAELPEEEEEEEPVAGRGALDPPPVAGGYLIAEVAALRELLRVATRLVAARPGMSLERIPEPTDPASAAIWKEFLHEICELDARIAEQRAGFVGLLQLAWRHLEHNLAIKEEIGKFLKGKECSRLGEHGDARRLLAEAGELLAAVPDGTNFYARQTCAHSIKKFLGQEDES